MGVVSLESDARYHPENQGAKPKWIPLSEMALDGSIGRVLVDDIPDLGSRLRPETTFNQLLTPLLLGAKSYALKELQVRGMATVGAVLSLPADSLSSFTRAVAIEGRLKAYLDGLSITPHGKLFGEIFGKKPDPLPSDREQKLINVVEEAVASLTFRESRVITRRFGLEDGTTQTLEVVGKEFRLTAEMIRQIEAKALRRLRHQSRSTPLKNYDLPKPLPQPETVFVAPGEEQLQESPVNNLLPEIPLTPEALAKVCNIPIEYLGLYVTTQNAIIRAVEKKRNVWHRETEVTVGDLLQFSKVEFWDIWNLGEKGIRDVGEELQALLNLPPEEYPQGFVSELLAKKIKSKKKNHLPA